MNTIELYGEIGYEITVNTVSKSLTDLKNMSDELTALIYSPGGSVFEGIGIYNILKSYPGRKVAKVVGLSASMMTFVMLAFDEIQIVDSAYVMIHNPRGGAYGDKEEIKKHVGLLEKLAKDMAEAYCKKTGKSLETIQELMNKETWMTATEALEMGFVDKILEEDMKMAASIKPEFLKNAPPLAVKALTKTTTKNQSNNSMNTDLLKALSLPEGSSEIEAVQAVKTITAKMATFTSDLQAKSDLISGLNAKISEKQSELDSIKAQIQSFEKSKLLSKILEDQNVLVSDEVKAKLEKQIEGYLSDKDESRLEMINIMAKHFGVPRNQSNGSPEGSRKDFTATSSNEDKIVSKTDELLNSSPNVYAGAEGYLKARSEAIKLLGLENKHA